MSVKHIVDFYFNTDGNSTEHRILSRLHDQNRSLDTSQVPLCPNLTKKFQKEVFQIVNHNLPLVMLLGGLSVNLNHLIILHRVDIHRLINLNRVDLQTIST